MLERLIEKPEPLALLFAGIPLLLVVVAFAYLITTRVHADKGGRADAAFSIGQGAIFGLIALILGFSFAFAAGRYDTRRTLIVAESGAISTAFNRSDMLAPAQRTAFRRILIEYAQTRLDAYTNIADASAEAAALARSDALQTQLWHATMSGTLYGHRDVLVPLFVASVNDVASRADQETAALDNHLPASIFCLVVLCALTGAVLLGIAFGRTGAPHIALAVLYCGLCAATVFTIADLDHAHGGFIQLDAAGLQRAIDGMTGHLPVPR